MNPISAVLLRMSESEAWGRRISSWPVTRRVVERFIPGEHLDDAVGAARRLNAKNMATSLNPVGEHVHHEAEATAATDGYVEILDRIRRERLDSNMSIKLSMIGLDIGTEVAAANVERILAKAAEAGTFVRIDMESSAYIDRTLDIYHAMLPRFPEVGVVIQAYLRRSAADVDRLLAKGAAVRLVKGAYQEPADIAFVDKTEVDRSFARLTARMLDDEARANGLRLAVATHDRALVDSTIELARQRGIERGPEFQMLYGIARDLQTDTVAAGFPVRVYISYGPEWYPWFMRRLAENPANLRFFLKNLAG